MKISSTFRNFIEISDFRNVPKFNLYMIIVIFLKIVILKQALRLIIFKTKNQINIYC